MSWTWPAEEVKPSALQAFVRNTHVLGSDPGRVAWRGLPPGYRTIFVLHDVEGYEHNEIATIVGCSIGNSKSQLHKARMKLRDLLKMQRAAKAEKS